MNFIAASYSRQAKDHDGTRAGDLQGATGGGSELSKRHKRQRPPTPGGTPRPAPGQLLSPRQQQQQQEQQQELSVASGHAGQSPARTAAGAALSLDLAAAMAPPAATPAAAAAAAAAAKSGGGGQGRGGAGRAASPGAAAAAGEGVPSLLGALLANTSPTSSAYTSWRSSSPRAGGLPAVHLHVLRPAGGNGSTNVKSSSGSSAAAGASGAEAGAGGGSGLGGVVAGPSSVIRFGVAAGSNGSPGLPYSTGPGGLPLPGGAFLAGAGAGSDAAAAAAAAAAGAAAGGDDMAPQGTCGLTSRSAAAAAAAASSASAGGGGSGSNGGCEQRDDADDDDGGGADCQRKPLLLYAGHDGGGGSSGGGGGGVGGLLLMGGGGLGLGSAAKRGGYGGGGVSGAAAAAAAAAAASAHTADLVLMCKRLWLLAWPLSWMEVLAFAKELVITAYVGHLGAAELSALVLAQTVYNVTGNAPMLGFVTAMETFCGQAFGAGRHRLVGLVLQRGLAISLLYCCAALWLWQWNGTLLVWMGQDPTIAAAAAKFTLALGPALFMDAADQCCRRYLSSQAVVQPLMMVTLVATLLTPLYLWLFVKGLGMGLLGAAVAWDAVQATSLVLMIVCCRVHTRAQPPSRCTWPGWSREAFREWRGYIRMALPSCVMICLDWWTFEVIVMLSGLLPRPEQTMSMMGITFNIHALCFFAAHGLSGAASARVGNDLGAGRPQLAWMTVQVAVLLGTLVMCASSLLLLLGRHQVGRLFSNEAGVVGLTAQAVPPLAVSLIGEGANTVLAGVMRGCGRQRIGAAINLVTYWLFGLPIACLLAFPGKLGALGLWTGLACTASVQALLMSMTVFRFNWVNEAARAKALVAAGELVLEPEGPGGAAAAAHDDGDEPRAYATPLMHPCGGSDGSSLHHRSGPAAAAASAAGAHQQQHGARAAGGVAPASGSADASRSGSRSASRAAQGQQLPGGVGTTTAGAGGGGGGLLASGRSSPADHRLLMG